ncbi:MAG: hypothetical protein ACXU86_21880, partial [Archangium sp.]
RAWKRAPYRRSMTPLPGQWTSSRTTTSSAGFGIVDIIYRNIQLTSVMTWEAYEQMRGWFARGLAFERVMVNLLEADAQLPRAQRRFLGDFNKPRIEANVGVRKPSPGLRFADVLVIEEGELGGRPRRVETFSFKSRDLSGLDPDTLKAQMIADAREALRKYGETLDIRRGSLQPLLPGGSEVQVPRVRLIYEGGALLPKMVDKLDAAVNAAKEEVPGVEVLFQ